MFLRKTFFIFLLFSLPVFVFSEESSIQEEIKHYSDLIEKNGENGYYYFNRGLYYFYNEDFENALSDYQTASKLLPEERSVFYNLGTIFLVSESYAEAASNFSLAIEILPSDTNSFYNRGICRKNLGLLDEAKSDYETVVQLDPNYSWAYINLGNLFLKQGETQSAIESYSNAIKTAEAFAESQSQYGGSSGSVSLSQNLSQSEEGGLSSSSNPIADEALASYNLSIALSEIESGISEDAPVLDSGFQEIEKENFYEMGNLSFDEGDFAAAADYYEKTIEENPDFTNAYYNLAIAQYKIGDPELSIETLSSAIEIAPDDADLIYFRAILFYNNEAFEEAKEDFEKAVALGSEKASELYDELQPILMSK